MYKGLNFSTSSQHLLSCVFLIIASLLGGKWYLIVVLICIFLMTNDIEHLFTFFPHPSFEVSFHVFIGVYIIFWEMSTQIL